jgi:hypothetical protein
MVEPDQGTITINNVRKIDIPGNACVDPLLIGSWNLQASGDNISTTEGFALIGRVTFDANGGLGGDLGSSKGGRIERTRVSGTFAVNPDCTFRAKLINADGQPSTVFGTLFYLGEQFFFIYSDDGLVVTGTARRAAN